MNTAQFITDLQDLKQENFNFKYAIRHKQTKKSNIHLVTSQNLKQVLENHNVCISGFLILKFGYESTKKLEYKYGFTELQLDCIIQAKAKIEFLDGTTLKTPKNKASLEEVKLFILQLFKNENWQENNIKSVKSKNRY